MSGFYGGYGIRTCNGTFVLQHNMHFYLSPLEKKKIPERGLLLLAMGYSEELPLSDPLGSRWTIPCPSAGRGLVAVKSTGE